MSGTKIAPSLRIHPFKDRLMRAFGLVASFLLLACGSGSDSEPTLVPTHVGYVEELLGHPPFPAVDLIAGVGSEIWVVSHRVGPPPEYVHSFDLFLHWDGERWEEVSTVDPGKAISSLWGISERDVWATAYGLDPDREILLSAVQRWDGNQWTTVLETPDDIRLLDVFGGGPEDVWVVGNNWRNEYRDASGFVLHWNGTEWQEIQDPAILGIINWGHSSENHGVVIGGNGWQAVFDGDQWSRQESDAWLLHIDDELRVETETGDWISITGPEHNETISGPGCPGGPCVNRWMILGSTVARGFDDLWVAGDQSWVVSDDNCWFGPCSAGRGIVGHWNGSAWTIRDVGMTTRNVYREEQVVPRLCALWYDADGTPWLGDCATGAIWNLRQVSP